MNNYDDIINLPHHISKNHKRMSINDRAAQFAPFSALNGYQQAIEEASRYKERKIDLTDDEQLIINKTLLDLKWKLPCNVTLIHFIEEDDSTLGHYEKAQLKILKIDEIEQFLVLENKQIIKFNNIYKIHII